MDFVAKATQSIAPYGNSQASNIVAIGSPMCMQGGWDVRVNRNVIVSSIFYSQQAAFQCSCS